MIASEQDQPIDFSSPHQVRDITHNHPLVSCRYHPAGKLVFAGNENFEILRYDLDQPDDRAKSLLPPAHDSWVHALAFAPDGSILYTGGNDGRLIFWSDPAGNPSPARTIEAHAGWLNAIAVSRSGNLIATAGNDRMIRLWSAADGTLEAEFPGHDRPVYRVAFLPSSDDRFLLSADLLGRVVQWEIATRKEVRRLDAAKLYKYETGQGVDYGGVRDLAFSPDGTRLACSGLVEASNPLGAVSIPAVLELSLDWSDAKEIVLARPKEAVNGVGWGVRWHSSGTIILVSGGTGGGFLWFFEPGKPNEMSKLALPNTARDLDLSPDGRYVACAHHDGHLRIVGLFQKV
jgi:WD40 repeat protein